MKKEIYRRNGVYGSSAEHKTSLVAEFDYDDFQITEESEPVDNVKISYIDGGKELHGVYISFDELEAIYLAAKEAKANR